MKKIFTSFIVIIFVFTLISCKNERYRDDVSADKVIEAVAIYTDQENKLALADESYIREYMKIDISKCSEYAVMIPDSTINMDEYAVFKADDIEKAVELQKEIDSYLKKRNDSWMPEYLPDQYPKIKNAESKRAGVYIMYAILGDEYRQDAFDAFLDTLKDG